MESIRQTEKNKLYLTTINGIFFGASILILIKLCPLILHAYDKECQVYWYTYYIHLIVSNFYRTFFSPSHFDCLLQWIFLHFVHLHTCFYFSFFSFFLLSAFFSSTEYREFLLLLLLLIPCCESELLLKSINWLWWYMNWMNGMNKEKRMASRCSTLCFLFLQCNEVFEDFSLSFQMFVFCTWSIYNFLSRSFFKYPLLVFGTLLSTLISYANRSEGERKKAGLFSLSSWNSWIFSFMICGEHKYTLPGKSTLWHILYLCLVKTRFSSTLSTPIYNHNTLKSLRIIKSNEKKNENENIIWTCRVCDSFSWKIQVK